MNCANEIMQQMLGVWFLLLVICAFFRLGGIRRAWLRTPFSPRVFCCFICCGRGFINPYEGDNRSDQTILHSSTQLLHSGYWAAGTVGTCTGSFSLGCQTSNTTTEERQIHMATAYSNVLW